MYLEVVTIKEGNYFFYVLHDKHDKYFLERQKFRGNSNMVLNSFN